MCPGSARPSNATAGTTTTPLPISVLLLPNDPRSPGSASEGEVPLKGVGRGGARAALTNQRNFCGTRISAGTRHQKISTATETIAKVPSSVSHLSLICSSFVSHLSFICRSSVLRVPGTFGSALGALPAVLEAYRKHLGHPMGHLGTLLPGTHILRGLLAARSTRVCRTQWGQ